MQYDFGQSSRKKLAAKRESLSAWHPWFAWYPVDVGFNDWRWLENVGRRFYNPHKNVIPYWLYMSLDHYNETADERRRVANRREAAYAEALK